MCRKIELIFGLLFFFLLGGAGAHAGQPDPFRGLQRDDLHTRFAAAFQGALILQTQPEFRWFEVFRAYHLDGFPLPFSWESFVRERVGDEELLLRLRILQPEGLGALSESEKHALANFGSAGVAEVDRVRALFALRDKCLPADADQVGTYLDSALPWIADNRRTHLILGYLVELRDSGCLSPAKYAALSAAPAQWAVAKLNLIGRRAELNVLFDLAHGGYFSSVPNGAILRLAKAQQRDGSWAEDNATGSPVEAMVGSYVLASVLREGGEILTVEDMRNIAQADRILIEPDPAVELRPRMP